MATEVAVETQQNWIGGKWGPGLVRADVREPEPG